MAWLVCATVLSGVTTARAHDFTITRAVAVLKADDTYIIDVVIDVDALALGVSPVVPSAELAAALQALSAEELEAARAAARDTLRRRVRVRFDGTKVQPEISFPHGAATFAAAPAGEPTVFGTTARLEGRIPDGARQFRFGASRALKVVQLTVLIESAGTASRYLLDPGADSPAIDLLGGSADAAPPALFRYLVLGFEHILPKGLDHILFVLGLFLLSVRFKPLVWQVTAFTMAHSITLALSMAGIAELSSRIVEPLIAVSIAWVAIENLCVTELKPRRVVLVFVFGLLHGMGFAGVLRELGLPPGQFATALIGFNLGVEFGQLAVVGLAAVILGWARARPWYRHRIVWPLSVAIAGVGLYWAVERVLAG